MKLNDIRQAFLSYFAQQGHAQVESASLVPAGDATLLFTNAGMVPFKDVFLGADKRAYTRATSAQKCVRAGGKHNDLDNVGYTARHHTFFEMLGNFSFGDYFKREAIQFAWTFLTQELKLPAEKLWVTVYEDDAEAENIWLSEMGISAERFSRCGEKDNFWSMGDTGPCGPCTEIFYDHGPEVPGGPPGTPEEDGDRYVEIWNLVFMQYDRASDGTLSPLPKPSVDTGMGLERIAAVLQGVHSNYDIDLFQGLIQRAASLLSVADVHHPSLKVIADHIRASAFLIADGVFPSNEGRGYVLRRIIRRAIRHGHQLGAQQAFFHDMVPTLTELMGQAYPTLVEKQESIMTHLKQEEDQFAKTLGHGMQLLAGEMRDANGKRIDGETVFKLYDTYGFPVDLTADLAREKGFEVDMAGFEKAMEQQRAMAKAASTFKMADTQGLQCDVQSDFTGYTTEKDTATVRDLIQDGQRVEQLLTGHKGLVILDKTPFYAESGGQVGDTGLLKGDDWVFRVHDTQKHQDAICHQGEVISGSLPMGASVVAEIDEERRAVIKAHHSATHLLHAALREILGAHVEQKGSLVSDSVLRFDFSHPQPISSEALVTIARRVNEKILENSPVTVEIMSPEAAKQKGATALFGEKYGDEVRVLTMGGDFSIELCGGTHVDRTGDIGPFVIVNETGIAAGIRRIEAYAHRRAHGHWESQADHLRALNGLLKAPLADMPSKVEQLQAHVRSLEKEKADMSEKLARQAGTQWADEAKSLGDIKLLVKTVSGVEPKALRNLVDTLKDRLGNGAVLLALEQGPRVQLIAGVTKPLTKSLSAVDLVNHVASQVGGKGGGRPDMAQAGGTQTESLSQAMESVEAWVVEQLN